MPVEAAAGRNPLAAKPLPGVMDRIKRLRVLVSGTVQGVWFRESTRQEAERLGVAGWVRNLPDGRVEAAFEGPAMAVQAMAAWCQHGPPNAAVEQVEVTSEAPQRIAPPFRVLR